MNMNITDTEKKALKRMAALNLYETGEGDCFTPQIHLLGEGLPEEVSVPLSEYDEYKYDISTVQYGCAVFGSLESMVAFQLKIGIMNPTLRDIEKYNRKAKAQNLPLFVSYDNAMSNGSIPGAERKIYGLADYLMVYGLDPNEVVLKRYGNELIGGIASFTKKELEEFRDTPFCVPGYPLGFLLSAAATGDTAVLMRMLLNQGQQLLSKETYGLKYTATSRLTEEEVMEQYIRTPEEECCIATYDLVLPSQMTTSGKSEQAKLCVFASGKVYDWGNRRKTEANIHVVFSCNGEDKKCKWPFSEDFTGSALKEQANVVKLLNYVRYY